MGKMGRWDDGKMGVKWSEVERKSDETPNPNPCRMGRGEGGGGDGCINGSVKTGE